MQLQVKGEERDLCFCSQSSGATLPVEIKLHKIECSIEGHIR